MQVVDAECVGVPARAGDVLRVEIARMEFGVREGSGVHDARGPETAAELEVGERSFDIARRDTVHSSDVVEPYGRQLAKEAVRVGRVGHVTVCAVGGVALHSHVPVARIPAQVTRGAIGMIVVFGWEKTAKRLRPLIDTHCYRCNR